MCGGIGCGRWEACVSQKNQIFTFFFFFPLIGTLHYLFANGGKMMSLRWLTLIQDFAETQRANWGQACLAYLFYTLNTLSLGTLSLQGLGSSFRLFLVFPLVACSLANYHLANCHLASNLWFVLPFAVVDCQVWPYNSGQ